MAARTPFEPQGDRQAQWDALMRAEANRSLTGPGPRFSSVAASPYPEDPEVEWADYGKTVMAGGANLVSGAGWLAKAMGANDIGQAIMETGNNAVDYWHESLSDAAKTELSKEFIHKNAEGEYEWGGASLRTVALMGAESLLPTAIGMGAGAGITKALQLFANPAAKAALQAAVTAGQGAAKGTPAAIKAAAAAKKLSFVDDVMKLGGKSSYLGKGADKATGAIGFGLGEGTVTGMATGASVYDQVMSLDHATKMQNERYRQVYESTDEAMSEAERQAYASETVAMEASTMAGWQAGLTTAILGAPAGAFLGRLIGRAAKREAISLARGVVTGGSAEFSQEFSQSGTERFISNLHVAAFDKDLDLFTGVLEDAVAGGVVGFALGAGFGAAHAGGQKLEDRKQRAKTPGTGDPLADITIEAAQAKVPYERIMDVVHRVKKKDIGFLAGQKELRELIKNAGQPEKSEDLIGQTVEWQTQDGKTIQGKVTRRIDAETDEGERARGWMVEVNGQQVYVEDGLAISKVQQEAKPEAPEGAPDKPGPAATETPAPTSEAPVLPESGKTDAQTIPVPEPSGAAQGEDRTIEKTEINGFKVNVQQRKGEERGSGVLAHDYGEIPDTLGRDGDPIDVYIGDDPESSKVFVANLNWPDGSFQQHKTLMNFTDLESATAGFRASYPPGHPAHTSDIVEMDMEKFREWSKSKQTNARLSVDKNGDPVTPPQGATIESFAGDKRVQTQYQLREADDLLTSNDESGRTQQGFPKKLQPRDRNRQASAQWLTEKSAKGKFTPELLTEGPSLEGGAPLISPEGVVESGNGRVNLVRKVYGRNGTEYLDYLKANAEKFGLKAADIEGMNKPVLVRVRQDEMTDKQLTDLTRAANTPEVARLSPAEQARVDSDRIRDQLERGMDPNSPIMRAAFLATLTAAERGGLMTAEGKPTKQVSDRIEAAAFALAYDSDRLLALMAEEADTDIRNILRGLVAAAPAFAKARSASEDGSLGKLDIVKNIVDAAEQMRAIKARGRTVDEWIRQQGLFGDIDSTTVDLMEFMQANIRSGKRLGELFSAMGGFVEGEILASRNQEMFGERPADVGDVVNFAENWLAQGGQQQSLVASETQDILPEKAPEQIQSTVQYSSGVDDIFYSRKGKPWKVLAEEGNPDGRPHAPSDELRQPVSQALSQQGKYDALHELAVEAREMLTPIMDIIEAKYDVEIDDDIKTRKSSVGKANRDAIITGKNRPWWNMEFLRDIYRFKAEVTSMDQAELVIRELRDQFAGIGGLKVVKSDADKFINPLAFGWRPMPIDFLFPNGLIVEMYIAPKEMLDAAGPQGGHVLFERWRNRDPSELTPRETRRYERDMLKSQRLYQVALNNYMTRTGQAFSDVVASVMAADTLARSMMGINPSDNVPSVNPSSLASSDQAPSVPLTALSPVAESSNTDIPEYSERPSNSSPDISSSSSITGELYSRSGSDTSQEQTLEETGHPGRDAPPEQIVAWAQANAPTEPPGRIVPPRFRREGTSVPADARPSMGQLRLALAKPIRAVQSLVNFQLVQSTSELPGAAVPSDVEGAWYDGTDNVYLVADNLPTLDRARDVFVHEVFGHMGMESLPEFKMVLNAVRQLRARNNPAIMEVANAVRSTQGHIGEEREAKEIIALMAERGTANATMGRLRAGVRNFLRNSGMQIEYTEDEINYLIMKGMRDYLSTARLRQSALNRMPEAQRMLEDPDATVRQIDNALQEIYARQDLMDTAGYLSSEIEALKPLAKNSKTIRDTLASLETSYDNLINPSGARLRGGLPTTAMWSRAYHGSASAFTEFDLARIGTGEGFQAFGYGLYFAQSLGVAKSYVPFGSDIAAADAKAWLQKFNGDKGKAIADLSREIKEWYDDGVDPEKLERLRDLIKAGSKGQLYEVDIPDEAIEEMLDWDTPVDWDSEFGQRIASEAEESGLDIEDLREIMGAPGSGYEGQAEDGRSIYQWLSSSLGGDKEASKWLDDRNIPGIKYFDGSSRSAGEGTRNLVVFDASLAQIKTRNGLPLLSRAYGFDRGRSSNFLGKSKAGREPIGYRIIDTQTGEQVGATYQVGRQPRPSVAKRVNTRIDKLDNEYGAVRYQRQPVYAENSGQQPLFSRAYAHARPEDAALHRFRSAAPPGRSIPRVEIKTPTASEAKERRAQALKSRGVPDDQVEKFESLYLEYHDQPMFSKVKKLSTTKAGGRPKTVDYMTNPTQDRVTSVFGDSEELRWLVERDGDVHVWAGEDAHHEQMGKGLGVDWRDVVLQGYAKPDQFIADLRSSWDNLLHGIQEKSTRPALIPVTDREMKQGAEAEYQKKVEAAWAAGGWRGEVPEELRDPTETFIPLEPRPLFSRAKHEDPDIERMIGQYMATPLEDITIKDRFRNMVGHLRNIDLLSVKQGIVDSFASVAEMERGLFGGDLLDASESSYKAALATKNMSSVMAAIMHRGIPTLRDGAFHVKPGREGVMTWMAPITQHKDGNLLAIWELYAAARRASRLQNEKNRDGTSKEKLMSREDIKKAIALENQYPVFRQVFDDWQKFNTQALDLAEKSGVIDPEARKIWAKNDYVPFYRAMEQVEYEGGQGPVTGRQLRDVRSGIKTLHGADKPLGNVFENMMMNTAYLIDASFRNNAMQKIVEQAEFAGAMTPVPMAWQPVQFTTVQIRNTLAEAGVEVGDMTPEQRDQWVRMFRRVAPSGQNVVSVLVNGKPKYYEVHDPLLLRAVGSMGAAQFGGVTNMFRMGKKLLTTAVTIDPAFMMANFIRDTLSTWVVTDVGMPPVSAAVKGLKAAWAEDEDMLALMMAGAGGGGFYEHNPSDVRRMLAKKMPKGNVDGFMNTVLTPRRMWRFWQKVGAASEQGNRIGVYKQVRAQGGTVAEGAYQARDVLNFTMSGDYAVMKGIVQSIPFLNARVQGLYRLGRGAKENPMGFAMKGAMLTAATLALLAKNSGDDDYEALPEWDKDTYWHFFVGEGKDREHFRLPKPFEVGALFATVPERMWRKASGQDDWNLVRERGLAMFRDTFAFNPVPQLVKPLYEQWANKNSFTGSPIVGMALKNLDPEGQYTPWTSETMKLMAAAMPDFAPEWLRSPRRLEAALRGYTGTTGMYALGVADAITRGVMNVPDRPTKAIQDYPVVKRFWRNPNPRTTKYSDELYDMLNEANGLFRTMNAYRMQRRLGEAQKLMKENRGKLAVRKRLNKISTSVRKVNHQIRRVLYSDMDGDTKKARIDVLTQRKNKLMARVVRFSDLF